MACHMVPTLHHSDIPASFTHEDSCDYIGNHQFLVSSPYLKVSSLATLIPSAILDIFGGHYSAYAEDKICRDLAFPLKYKIIPVC